LLAVADFNQDGMDDLLVADDVSRTAALFISWKGK
jgi:membrane-bound lytic murein transglycosylase B